MTPQEIANQMDDPNDQLPFILDDYAQWSGGFPPEECTEEQIRQYAEHANPTTLTTAQLISLLQNHVLDSLIQNHHDNIPGGVSDKKRPEDFDRDQLQKGVRVELEHTNDSKMALEIAMDHLSEDPRYYDKLQEIGL